MTALPSKLLDGATREFALEMLCQPPHGTLAPGERRLMNLVLPPWQRPEVWDAARKRAFIEGLFLGLGAGFYVVHGSDWGSDGDRSPMSGWLLDGQQRITAIRDFLADDLAIFDGTRWSDLSALDQRRRFLYLNFPCVEIAYQADEQKLKQIYTRMNFGGVAHTQEDLDRLGPEIEPVPRSQRPIG